jgi:hypothetical protein
MADESDNGGGLTGAADDAGASQNNGDAGGGGDSSPTFSSPFQIYGEQGVIQDNLNTIPEEFEATRNFFGKYGSAKALDDGIKNVGFLARSKGFEPLGGDATDAEKASHQATLKNVLGLPDGVDGYGIEKPEGMEDAAWEKMNVNEYLEVALQHNVTPTAMKALMELDGARRETLNAEAAKAGETALAEQHESLTQEFGGKLEGMYQKANQIADLLGLPRDEIKTASVVKALNKAAEMISESKLSNSNEGERSDKAGSFKAQAEAIFNDPSNAYNADFKSGNHERVQRAMAENTRLMKLHAEQQKGKI